VKSRTGKLAAFIACLALAAAFPVLSSADKGGIPHNNKPCPAKGKRHHKKPHPNNKGLHKGKKCGFQPGFPTTTGPTGETGPTGVTGVTGTSGPTG
jgi:hypothetical protein